MDRKNLPLILMLTAGAITCVINLIRHYSVISQLIVLLIVLILFYVLGSAIKWTLDYFDAQNEQLFSNEGEVIEKESELMGGDDSDG
ncbi:MAG: hypothetical protein IJ147_03840 [Lachnospiraceae bacterium]|nr:hypothetical protein [Lachnospiraceae bacterium]